MNKCIYYPGDEDIFTELDASKGYWKIKMNPSARYLANFTSRFFILRFLRMRMGINDPVTFKRFMDIILYIVRCKLYIRTTSFCTQRPQNITSSTWKRYS